MNSLQSISSVLQFLPDIRGKRRICSHILKLLGVVNGRDLTIRTKSGLFFLPNIIEIISFELFVNGAYEKGLVNLLIQKIPPGGIFLDIGANIGSISIPLAIARPDIKIIAVEASPWIFSILKKNIELNKLSSIELLNKAVYHNSGLQLKMYAPRELFGKGSLNPVFTQVGEDVNTITVDDIAKNYQLNRLDMIKVDVEGFEASIFSGLSETVISLKPVRIFEYSARTEEAAGFKPGEAQARLMAMGYKLQQLDQNFRLHHEILKSGLQGKSANLYAS